MSGEIQVQHVEGKHQLADAMTKALERVRLKRLREEIGMECVASSGGGVEISEPAAHSKRK